MVAFLLHGDNAHQSVKKSRRRPLWGSTIPPFAQGGGAGQASNNQTCQRDGDSQKPAKKSVKDLKEGLGQGKGVARGVPKAAQLHLASSSVGPEIERLGAFEAPRALDVRQVPRVGEND